MLTLKIKNLFPQCTQYISEIIINEVYTYLYYHEVPKMHKAIAIINSDIANRIKNKKKFEKKLVVQIDSNSIIL